MNFEKKINQYKDIIDNILVEIYNDGPIIIKEPIKHILVGGKRFRPILCLLTTASFKGNEKIALKVGIAIELLHNFTLIHDDIMDDDNYRHGKTTIHNEWNQSIAILSGDAILALALIKLSKINNNQIIINKFHQALIEVCEGQALDLMFQDQEKVLLEDYLTMIDKKTGHMIGLCSELGSIISNVNMQI